MFKGIFKKLSGRLDYSDYLEWSLSIIKSFNEEPKSIIGSILNSEEWTREWTEYITPDLREISEERSKKSLKLKLREKAIENIEYSHKNRPLITKGLSDEDKRILVSELHKESTYDETISLTTRLAIYSQAAYTCYMTMSEKLVDDAKPNDWFALYHDVYKQYVTQLYSQTISETKGEANPLSPMLPVLAQKKDEIRSQILQGRHWNYTRDNEGEE